MSNAQAIEYRITQRVIARRARKQHSWVRRFASSLIVAAAVTIAVLLVAAYLQGLLWALLAVLVAWQLGL